MLKKLCFHLDQSSLYEKTDQADQKVVHKRELQNNLAEPVFKGKKF